MQIETKRTSSISTFIPSPSYPFTAQNHILFAPCVHFEKLFEHSLYRVFYFFHSSKLGGTSLSPKCDELLLSS